MAKWQHESNPPHRLHYLSDCQPLFYPAIPVSDKRACLVAYRVIEDRYRRYCHCNSNYDRFSVSIHVRRTWNVVLFLLRFNLFRRWIVNLCVYTSNQDQTVAREKSFGYLKSSRVSIEWRQAEILSLLLYFLLWRRLASTSSGPTHDL